MERKHEQRQPAFRTVNAFLGGGEGDQNEGKEQCGDGKIPRMSILAEILPKPGSVNKIIGRQRAPGR